MANREKIKDEKLDKKIFKNTANKTKKVNIDPIPMRGGTRL